MSSFDSRLKVILENLATLEAVRDHGKLRIAAAAVGDDDDATADITVTTHRLQIEDRWFEGVQRSRTGDGRRMTLAFVGRLLDEVERLADQARDEHLDPHDPAAGPAVNSMFEVDPLEALQQLSCAVRDANRGLSRLKSTTYAEAEQVVLDLTVLITRADAIAARINQFLIEPHKPVGAVPAAWGPPL